LLPLNYFDNGLFNRYQIEFTKEPINLETLKHSVASESGSVLVILNTIDDTKELHKLLQENYGNEDLLLLNTHFSPRHRKIKIYLAKRRLRQNKRIVVISTQLIEAGVDLDFPVVYRDFATIASIVQSAGRCNRNGKFTSLGQVKLFKLQNKGKIRSDIIYQGKDKEILRFTKESFLKKEYQEKELLKVQREFFNRIQSELYFAKHSQNRPKLDFDFLKDIEECQYYKIGQFQLIDKQLFGEEIQYYIPRNEKDNNFETLLQLQNQLIDLIKTKADRELIHLKKKLLATLLKKMSSQIVQIRLRDDQIRPLLACNQQYFNLFKIDADYYSYYKGIDLTGAECFI
jgi:CRISPR-associated endonuclease/helicase Cas3